MVILELLELFHLNYMQVPCILGVNLSDGDLLEFLQQVILTLSGHMTAPPFSSSLLSILQVIISNSSCLYCNLQLSDTDGSSTLPPSVLRVLNYKACRGKCLSHWKCPLLVFSDSFRSLITRFCLDMRTCLFRNLFFLITL